MKNVIQEVRIPEVVGVSESVVEKKQGGIKFGQLGLSLATLACGGMLTSCNSLTGESQSSAKSVSKSDVLACYDHTTSVDNIKTLQEYLAGTYSEYDKILTDNTAEGSSRFNGRMGPNTTKYAIADNILVMSGKKPCSAQNPNN